MKKQGMLRMFLFLLPTLILHLPVSAALLSANGFLNVPWGSTIRQVAQEMAQRKEFRVIPQRNSAVAPLRSMDSAGFSHIKLKGTITGHLATVEFRFLNNAFYEGQIVYRPDKSASLPGHLKNGFSIHHLDNSLRGILIEKYGLPRQDDKTLNYTTPEEIDRGENARWFLYGPVGQQIIIDYRICFPCYTSKHQYDTVKKHGVIIVTYTNQNLWEELCQTSSD